MKLLRSLILCGCTSDEPTRCAHKTWLSNGCKCPCHFSNEQTQRLLSAYMSVEQLAGYVEKRLRQRKPASSGGMVIEASCGHAILFEQPISKMSAQYVRHNKCEHCRAEEETRRP